MAKNLLCLIVAALICTGCVNIHSEQCPAKSKPECKEQGKVLRHVVLFKFKDDTSPEKIKEVENAFASLPAKIKAIHAFEWGTNVSVEDRSQGFTHCFLVSFVSEADRDGYLVHPDHKEFGKALGGSLDKVLVVDYWAR